MPGKTLVSFLCVFVLWQALGACGNPIDSVVMKDQENPGVQDQAGEASDPDQSGPEDQDGGEDPENGGDSDAGEGQSGDGGPDTAHSPGGESDAGNEPDSGDAPGSGDTPGTGEGQGSGDGTGAGEQPGNGDSPGSDDTPGAGEGQGSGGGPGSGEQPGTGDSLGSGDGAEGAVALTGVAALQEYLDGHEENTAATPYRIRLGGINVASKASGNAVKGLYAALSRYVALDLSGSYGETYVNVSLESVPAKEKITEIILPPGLHTIEKNAFAQCAGLVFADLSGAGILEHGAFSRCAKLATVIMEEVREIQYTSESADGAFHNCDSLVSVSLPRAVKIGKKSFNSCDALATVHAPLVEFIGDSAFANCKQLLRLTLGETPPELGEAVFDGGKPERIYVPASSVATYRTTDVQGWTEELKAKVQALP